MTTFPWWNAIWHSRRGAGQNLMWRWRGSIGRGAVWTQEIRPSRLASVRSDDDVSLVERYLALPEGRRTKLDVALARINRARRRLDSGDQAIEVGICQIG